ncbi:citrate transporter-like domain-containing protein, partial [Jimgerdemannia flammicorona]
TPTPTPTPPPGHPIPWTDRRTFLSLLLFLLVRYSLLLPASVHPPLGRTVLALLAACLTVVCGVLTPPEAAQSVHADAILILGATMLIAARLEERRGWVRSILLWRDPSPTVLLIRVSVLAGVMAGWVSSDGVGWMMTEVVVLMCKELGLNVAPFAMAVATSSTIGGALTLIGNPKNIILSTLHSSPTYLTFLLHMAPATYISLLLNTLLLLLVHRKTLQQPHHVDPALPPSLRYRRASFIPAEDTSDGWSTSTLDTAEDRPALLENTRLLFSATDDESEVDRTSESESHDDDETTGDDDNTTTTTDLRGRDTEDDMDEESDSGSGNDASTVRGQYRRPTLSSDYGDAGESANLLRRMQPQYASILTNSPGAYTVAITDYSFAATDDYFSPWKVPDRPRSLFSRRSSIVRFEWPPRGSRNPRSPGRPGRDWPSRRASFGRVETDSERGLLASIRRTLAAPRDVLTALVLITLHTALLAGLNSGYACLTAATILLAISSLRPHPLHLATPAQAITQDINWAQLVYLFSMFVIVAGVDVTPAPDAVWEWVGGAAGGDLYVLAGVAVAAGVIMSPVPALLLLAPRVAERVKGGGGEAGTAWFVLAWGLALCGCWTAKGSVAGMVAAVGVFSVVVIFFF